MTEARNQCHRPAAEAGIGDQRRRPVWQASIDHHHQRCRLSVSVTGIIGLRWLLTISWLQRPATSLLDQQQRTAAEAAAGIVGQQHRPADENDRPAAENGKRPAAETSNWMSKINSYLIVEYATLIVALMCKKNKCVIENVDVM